MLDLTTLASAPLTGQSITREEALAVLRCPDADLCPS